MANASYHEGLLFEKSKKILYYIYKIDMIIKNAKKKQEEGLPVLPAAPFTRKTCCKRDLVLKESALDISQRYQWHWNWPL